LRVARSVRTIKYHETRCCVLKFPVMAFRGDLQIGDVADARKEDEDAAGGDCQRLHQLRQHLQRACRKADTRLDHSCVGCE